MKSISKFAFAASIVLATALTFSCSSGDDPNEGGNPSSSGGGGVSSSSGGDNGGISNLPDLPKQVYLTEWGCCDDDGYYTVHEKEEYKGDANIAVLLYLDTERKGECDTIPAGKIRDGQLLLDLPANVDSKYLLDRVPCDGRRFDEPSNGEICQNNLSVVPENLAFYRSSSLHVAIPGRSYCSLSAYSPYLRNSGETGRAGFYYFPESGRIAGTETWIAEHDGGTYIISQENYDVNFSKGWNLVSVNYHDPDDYDDSDNYAALTTDLSKGGTWEWWLECY